jgi:hypothetical protein
MNYERCQKHAMGASERDFETAIFTYLAANGFTGRDAPSRWGRSGWAK